LRRGHAPGYWNERLPISGLGVPVDPSIHAAGNNLQVLNAEIVSLNSPHTDILSCKKGNWSIESPISLTNCSRRPPDVWKIKLLGEIGPGCRRARIRGGRLSQAFAVVHRQRYRPHSVKGAVIGHEHWQAELPCQANSFVSSESRG
jgi:hypothetical protein